MMTVRHTTRRGTPTGVTVVHLLPLNSKSTLHYLLCSSKIALKQFSLALRTILSDGSRWRWRDAAGGRNSPSRGPRCLFASAPLTALATRDACVGTYSALPQVCIQSTQCLWARASGLAQCPLHCSPPVVDSANLRPPCPAGEQTIDSPVRQPAGLCPPDPVGPPETGTRAPGLITLPASRFLTRTLPKSSLLASATSTPEGRLTLTWTPSARPYTLISKV
ncbi:uncharacterized protein LOC115300303 [Suricata suricatta]|uniref:uncharacterized protein LOC115300303 n=1 Tax=Suricata suricatta TaxID=37032 RepID=UPI001155D8F8|nr:uncharacterized protein LOC115300303 [Suricata suricatta]